MVRIGIVAGEASGDQLGAGLITALRERIPDAHFEGIAGSAMIAAGCEALYPADKLAVMGLVEVLGHLRELFAIRRALVSRFLRDPPDLFIGIDAPDFNLGLEGRLHTAGIPTIHYVSPSIWAWRRGRVRKIARNVDLMLTLFPFEAEFYREHGVPAHFVGHPFADLVPLQPDRSAARWQLGIAADARVVALLPGSRVGEIRRLGEAFVRAAVQCRQAQPALQFVAPMAGAALRRRFAQIVQRTAPDLPLTLIDGQAREAMAAADVVLLASGTAALEALLLKRPMVVAYRVAGLTYGILRLFRLLKVSRFSLPNLLAGEELVPELIQGEATPDKLAKAVLAQLDRPQRARELEEAFVRIHRSLRRNASVEAAGAVLGLLPDGSRT